MKIRNGFVSNSSSSSFIILGINVSDDIFSKFGTDEKQDYEFFEESDIDYFYDEYGDGGYYLGDMLADGEEFLDEGSIDVENFKSNKKIEELKKMFKEKDIPLPPVKVYYGTRAT
jgi:hypothetical protein